MNINKQESTPLEYLKQLKLSAKVVAGHLLSDSSTRDIGNKILGCAGRLKIYSDHAYGTFIDTFYCKHRNCPVCQWRKSLRACSRMHSLLDGKPDLLNGKWIYLTLTVRNCLVEDLRSTIQYMNRAFQRLTNRQFWKQNVYGGIRFTEVGDGGLDIHSAHPHFHCLLLVSPSMYEGNNYISQKRWAEEWQQALQTHYVPIVHNRRLKGLGGDLRNQLISCTRYSMKPQMAEDAGNGMNRFPRPSRSWLVTTAQQMTDLRLIETLGQIRAVFGELDGSKMVFEAMEEREKIRQRCAPPIHRWDDLSDDYEPEA